MLIPRAVAVVVDGQRALVIKRFLRKEASGDCVMCQDRGWSGPNCPGHHYAVLPGGHVEDGESAADAALRELREETTLVARIERQVWTGRHNGRPASYYLVRDVRGSAVLSGDEAKAHGPNDSYELMWVTADAFDELNLHPADIREPLARLLRG
ncbi:NUDIX domain-containing protein [Streptomyces sp. VRA16 Mangrove soil]|uniref:NUDIX domain-containing protein n=1 Tax=Streptomyces sp. VRA16 Mangrove soil TaxID=2817434 RepID=UPI0027DB8998|nr:NUDIX domain-containing protein [Streptomyces sp. VRA16 Mangrove soil]